MMYSGVAITGMGIISSIGNTVEENYYSLIHKKSGLSYTKHIHTIHKEKIKVGEIALTNEVLEELLGLPNDNSFTRTSLLGAYAAKMAVEDAHIPDMSSSRTGLISATSVAGMDMTERYFHNYEQNPSLQKYIHSHHAGNCTQKIADYLGIKGMVSTISTACSSGANAIMLGATLIEQGVLDRVIVGGTDALCKFTINGFQSLLILSDTENKPFDKNRNGLNLGEAAAYLVLESWEQVQTHSKKVLACISGYGNANDAYHQTASSENGEGAYLAILKALQKANLQPDEIDYINVHGTATINNDLSESNALLRVFSNVPILSATKSYTGHTLAAAGAIEAVYSILSLQKATIFPTLHFTTKMDNSPLIPNTEVVHKNINHVLSNSFGFGGNCSSLIFSKCV